MKIIGSLSTNSLNSKISYEFFCIKNYMTQKRIHLFLGFLNHPNNRVSDSWLCTYFGANFLGPWFLAMWWQMNVKTNCCSTNTWKGSKFQLFSYKTTRIIAMWHFVLCIWVTKSLEGYLFCTKVYFLVYCSIHSYPHCGRVTAHLLYKVYSTSINKR